MTHPIPVRANSLLPALGLLLCAAIGLPALADNNLPSGVASSPTPTRNSSAPKNWTDAELQRVAAEAYVWGWPMVYLHNCRVALERLPAPGRCGGVPVAPPNQLCMLTDYLPSDADTVPCPNQDVVYGFGIFDLGIEPVVLQVPDFGQRFWLYQLGDQRTDSFAQLGAMYGTEPGLYLVVGPDWQDAAPPGLAGVLRCPTRLAFCLPRVLIDESEEDRTRVLPTLNQISAYPLSRYRGKMKTTNWEKVKWYPRVGPIRAGGDTLVVPEKFFDVLPEVLQDVPPLPGEEGRYTRYRELLELAASDSRVPALLREAAVRADKELVAPMFEFHNFGNPLSHHWTTIFNGGEFGTDYRTRAAVARSNIFVNRDEETKYYYQDFDVWGQRLDGHRDYRITFPAGRLPPARGFWSLTLYDEQHRFYPNTLGRHSLGTKNEQLQFNGDGSLTILIQHQSPSEGESVNWLPAPRGKFSLYLRAYWPDAPILTGEWLPPPVVRTTEALAFPVLASPAPVERSTPVRRLGVRRKAAFASAAHRGRPR